MDLSKLPKLSDTKSRVEEAAIPVEEVTETAPAPVMTLPRRPAVGGGIWLNLMVGILLLLISRDYGHYLFSRLTLQPFHTNVFWTNDSPNAGQEVEYFDLTGFTALNDMGVFLFGVVVLLEVTVKFLAAMIGPSTTTFVAIAVAQVMTAGAIGLNCYVCYKLLGIDITPIMSALAVAFGVWISFDLSRMGRWLGSIRRTPNI